MSSAAGQPQDSPNSSQAIAEPDEQIRARCDFIAALQQHIQQCEIQLNYPEAQKCKVRLDELYNEDRRARVIRLRNRHAFEIDGLEKVVAEETQYLDEAWRDKVQQYEFRAQDQLQKAREKHQQQRIDEEDALMDKISRQVPKASKTLLELRRTQYYLVKTGRYYEAEQYKIKGDALENLEQYKRDEDAVLRTKKHLEQFDRRIEVEYINLTSRIKQGRKQLKEARDADFERLKKKQENLRRDLLNQYAAEMNRLKRAPSGLPFVLDEDGNDVLSMPNGVSELNKMAGQKRVVQPAYSFVRAYIDGDLRVKAGDVYFSVTDQPAEHPKSPDVEEKRQSFKDAENEQSMRSDENVGNDEEDAFDANQIENKSASGYQGDYQDNGEKPAQAEFSEPLDNERDPDAPTEQQTEELASSLKDQLNGAIFSDQ